jgi:acetyl-CoA carboxylase biotin carboxyl carrier protein
LADTTQAYYCGVYKSLNNKQGRTQEAQQNIFNNVLCAGSLTRGVMNIDLIRECSEILRTNGLTLLELTEGNLHIRLEKSSSANSSAAVAARAADSPDASPVLPAAENLAEVNFNNLIEVKSPLVGVFYAAPSPDADPFVSIGGKVKKGDVLCIIETMKLMNEVLAEQDGEIMDVCIKDGDIAEFGQVLFKIL